VAYQGRYLKIIIFLTALSGLFCAWESVQAANIPVLMYHYIEAPLATTTLPGLYLEPQIFESQLQEIKKNEYNVVFISEVADSLRQSRSLPKCSLALTFDDGYEDFYTKAFPLLKKYNLKGALYVIINRLDTPGYVTRAQVREMAESGFIEIGSHTFNHPDLRTKKYKDAVFEIRDSRAELEKISGYPVRTFAYPYGHFNADDLSIAETSGYWGAVSVKPGVSQSADNLWQIKRLRPGQLSGQAFSDWLRESFRSKY